MGLLIRKEEKEVFDLINKMMARVMDAMHGVIAVVESFHAGDFSKIASQNDAVDKAETDVDKIKKQLRELLTSGSFLPPFRQDCLDLVSKIDDIADMAETCAKFFWITEGLFSRKKVPKGIKDKILEMAKGTPGIADRTMKAVSSLGLGEDIAPLLKEVGRLEKEEDGVEIDTLKKIIDANLDGFLTMELIQATRMVSNIYDRCNATAHIVNYMYASRV